MRMIRTDRIRTILPALVWCLVLVVLALIGWSAHELRVAYRQGHWLSEATHLADALLRASAAAARERGLTAQLLEQRNDRSAWLDAEIRAVRAEGDRYLAVALAVARALAIAPDSLSLDHEIDRVGERHARLVQARANIDRPTASPLSSQTWIATVTAYIEAMAELRRDAMVPTNALLTSHYYSSRVQEILFQFTEHTGRERAILSAAIAAGRPLTAIELAELDGGHHFAAKMLVLLQQTIAHSGDSSLGLSVAGLRDYHRQRYQPLREALIRNHASRGHYPISSDEWYRQASRMIDSAVEISQIVANSTHAAMSEAHTTIFVRAAALAMLFAIALVVLGLSIWFVRNRILKPLRALDNYASRIGTGDLTTPLPVVNADEFGHVTKTVNSMRESLRTYVTELQTAEVQLRDRERIAQASKTWLASVLDSTAEAIISVDDQQRIVMYNRGAARIFGYGETEALGQHLSMLLPESARARHSALVEAFVRGHETGRRQEKRCPMSGRRNDGTEFPAQASIARFVVDGRSYCTVVLRDITERREIEAARERLASILEATSDMVSTTSPDGKVLYVNQATRSALGIGSDADVNDSRIADFHPAWALERIMTDGLPGARTTGEWRGETALLGRNGIDIPVSQVILAHRNGHGDIEYFSTIMRDISEYKEMTARLQHDKEDLESLVKKLHETQSQLLQSEKMAAIGQLAAGVAHEINNPVGYVKSNISTLRRYVCDLLALLEVYAELEKKARERGVDVAQVDEQRARIDVDYLTQDVLALVDESAEGVDRVKRIVQDLKEFSHVGDADWQVADLHKGLDSTLNIVHNELKYKATVVKEYGEIPPIECIPSQLNQVFMNLLVNAAHSIEGHGTVTIRTGVHKLEVFVEIADTGAGISAENLQRIFEPFFTTKPVGEGTGLGLSLAYGIIQRHSGRIAVASEAGKGTVFRVWIPISQPDDGKQSARSNGEVTRAAG